MREMWTKNARCGRNDQTGEKMIANTAVHTVKTSLSGKLVGRKVGRLVGR